MTFDEEVQRFRSAFPYERCPHDSGACSVCGEEAFYSAVNEAVCTTCLQHYLELKAGDDARALAEKYCVIVDRAFVRYDPALDARPTPDEYAAGDRTAYSPNSLAAYHRHRKTNYDALFSSQDKHEPIDQLLYSAVHNRIRELVQERTDEIEWDYDDELNDTA